MLWLTVAATALLLVTLLIGFTLVYECNEVHLLSRKEQQRHYELVQRALDALEAHSVAYVVSDRTLLGVQRHAAVIPWDRSGLFTVQLKHDSAAPVKPILSGFGSAVRVEYVPHLPESVTAPYGPLQVNIPKDANMHLQRRYGAQYDIRARDK